MFEKVERVLKQSSEEGYDPADPMFRSLTPEEVDKFRVAARELRFEGIGTTLMDACKIYHPVTRLEIAYQMLKSLEEMGEIEVE